MVEIKGSNLDISKKILLNAFGQETFKKVLDRMDPKERETMAGPIWSVSWYPMDLFIHWATAIQAEIFKDDREGQLKLIVLPTIEEQFRSVYHVYQTLDSPEAVLGQLATITRTYFRGVTVEVTDLSSNSALIRYVGFQPQHRPIEVTIRAWWQRMLGAIPSRNFRFEIVTSIGEGRGCGEYRISWDKQQPRAAPG